MFIQEKYRHPSSISLHFPFDFPVFILAEKTPVLRGSQFKGFALNDRPIRSCPFSQDHIYFVRWPQPNIRGLMSIEKTPRGPWA